jgi:predicted ATPase/class 3 adenylate cyclase
VSEHGRALPSGLVTFVFTDIEGSTRLLREHPDTYPLALRRHRRLLHQAWSRHAGVQVNTEGDGTLVAFADATAAVLACAEAQRLLSEEPWPDGMQLRVRMGMHTGLAFPLDDDYVAMAVHQAARVAAAGHGGQVLVSEDTAAAVSAASGITLQPLGLFRVRDFERPIALLQVQGSGLGHVFPAVRAPPADGHSLPQPPTSFVGREGDVRRVEAALGPGRLVVIVGPGGVGKSRLAGEVAQAAQPVWPDGVWRIAVDELAPESDLATSIADVFGGTSDAPDPLAEVTAALAQQRALLLLDGCEHRVDETSVLVRTVLRYCPGVGLLVTSREPLHVAGEQVHRLRPLPTRPVTHVEDALAVAAVRLFVDRAHAVAPDFALTEGNLAAVSELAQRLDGLPLALEVAAGFAGAYAPEQMLMGLERDWQTMRSHDRSLPARQRSLHSLLSWSESVLSVPENAVFRRLSVLAGSFTLSAARAITAGGAATSDAVPEVLLSLVDRSLVVADPIAGGTRYRMLGLIRRFAALRLDQAGETEATLRAAGLWYHALVGPALTGDRLWLGRASADADNIRGLIPRLVAMSDTQARHLGGELAVSMVRYADAVQAYRSGVQEGRRWQEMLAPSPERVSLSTALAFVHLRLGETEKAQQLVKQAASERDAVGAPDWDDIGIERTSGEIATRAGHPEVAESIASRALARPRSLRSRLRLLNQLGIARALQGNLTGAAEAFDGELTAAIELGDDVLRTKTEANAAELALRRGRAAEAARHQRSCLALATALGQPVFVAYSMIVAARLEPEDVTLTVHLLTQARAILEKASHQLYDDDEARVRQMLAKARHELGDEAYGQVEAQARSQGIEQARALTDEVLGRRLSG